MKVFIRDESKMHKASTGILVSNVISIIVAIVTLLVTVFSRSYISLIIFILSLSWGIFCDLFFEYKDNVQIKLRSERYLTFSYELNKDFIPSANTSVEYVFSRVESIKFRRKEASVLGVYTVYKPLKNKESKAGVVKIPLNFGSDKDLLIEELKKLVREV